MAAPFIPFPIFPPYEHWRPNTATSFPENRYVRHRLEFVDLKCLPFMSAWYCSSFLEESSHRWTPSEAKQQYSAACRYLEQMLNWSFSTGLSLLDWEPHHFREYLEFLIRPPTTWCSSAPRMKYEAQPLTPFAQWKFNPDWRMFYRNIGESGAKPQTRRDLQRAVQVAQDFFSFYFTKTGISKNSCAAVLPTDLFDALSETKQRAFHSPHELDWAFDQLASGALPTLRSEQILLYMAIARFSRIRLGDVKTLSQFRLGTEEDNYFEYSDAGKGVVSIELDADFVFYLKRYLIFNQVDLECDLPPLPIFPTNNGEFGYSLDAVHQHMASFRSSLADLAALCADPNIKACETKFRRMSFASIRRSSIYGSRRRRRNLRWPAPAQ